jgi:hypothetical protein
MVLMASEPGISFRSDRSDDSLGVNYELGYELWILGRQLSADDAAQYGHS